MAATWPGRQLKCSYFPGRKGDGRKRNGKEGKEGQGWNKGEREKGYFEKKKVRRKK